MFLAVTTAKPKPARRTTHEANQQKHDATTQAPPRDGAEQLDAEVPMRLHPMRLAPRGKICRCIRLHAKMDAGSACRSPSFESDPRHADKCRRVTATFVSNPADAGYGREHVLPESYRKAARLASRGVIPSDPGELRSRAKAAQQK